MTTKGEETMRYTVETVNGDELEVHDTLTDATRSAVWRLQQDPELVTLYVYEIVRGRPVSEQVKTVTHGPDANWNSIVVVLDPGEKAQAPGHLPRQITEEDLEGYDLGDPKRASLERDIGTWV